MIAMFAWWLIIQVFGLAALPLAWRLFRRLPSRGYPLAKALGLLLVCYGLWLGATFRLLSNDVGGILVALLLVAGLSAWLGRDAWRRAPAPDAEATGRPEGLLGIPLVAWLRAHWKLVLSSELLLLLAFVAWSIFRAYSGEIAGTEKPMEFAFINGVLASRFFPPQDPWLSGYAISYYYFGYVMLATLIRLSGVAPAVGFNLGVASWFALTLLGVFGLVYDLVRLGAMRLGPAERTGEDSGDAAGADREVPPAAAPWRAIRYGLLGALLTGVIGNLEGLVELAYNARLLPSGWIEWLNIKDLTQSPPTGGMVGGFWWWWHASRVVHDQLLGNTLEVIDEFPFFSFLLGDLHPHVLGLPFVLLAIALAFTLLLEVRALAARSTGDAAQDLVPAGQPRPLEAAGARLGLVALGSEGGLTGAGYAGSFAQRSAGFWSFLGRATGLGAPGVLLYALVLGALSFLNTWDFPIYLALLALALGLGLALGQGMRSSVLGPVVGAGLIFGALGVLLYVPFYIGFQSQAGGVLPNLFFPTRFSQYFLMFGPLLVPAVFFLLLLTCRVPRAGLWQRFLRLVLWIVVVPLALLGVLVGAALLPAPLGPAAAEVLFRNNGQVANALGSRSPAQVAALVVQLRATNPWTFLVVAALIAWAGALLWTAVGQAAPPAERETGRETSAPDLFVVLMIGVALLLTFAVEFVFLKDYFSSRMNTVFKFYYQGWVLLAPAAAYGLSRLAARATRPALALPGLGLAGLLILAGLYYPLQATPSKANDFQSQPPQPDTGCPGQPTLDGLAFLCRNDYADFRAIHWLRANVPPAATVLEAAGGSYSPEGAERISMSTGNPTLLGWDFHERQWRGKAFDQVAGGRPEAVQAVYRASSPDELRSLLERWGIDYVYVGELERRKYGITDATLARFDRVLRRVYDQDGVRIYAR